MYFSQIDLRSYHTERACHSHDYAQLVLPLKGVLELEIGTSSGVISNDTGAFITAGISHSFAASKDNLFVVADLDQHFLSTAKIPSFVNLTPVIKQFLQFTYCYLSEKKNDRLSHSLINNLLLNLLNQAGFAHQDNHVLKAKNWIDLHFAEPINIGKIAELCHLSASQLQRRFKKGTGYNLAEYWRFKRLEHARHLLTSTILSVELIAFSVGYENLSAFSRSFNSVMGHYPSQWREMMLAANRMHLSDN